MLFTSKNKVNRWQLKFACLILVAFANTCIASAAATPENSIYIGNTEIKIPVLKELDKITKDSSNFISTIESNFDSLGLRLLGAYDLNNLNKNTDTPLEEYILFATINDTNAYITLDDFNSVVNVMNTTYEESPKITIEDIPNFTSNNTPGEATLLNIAILNNDRNAFATIGALYQRDPSHGSDTYIQLSTTSMVYVKNKILMMYIYAPYTGLDSYERSKNINTFFVASVTSNNPPKVQPEIKLPPPKRTNIKSDLQAAYVVGLFILALLSICLLGVVAYMLKRPK